MGRLARTFPAQIEALNRYRSRGEPAITAHNVSVGDGGKAIVGNVTQHASVIVADKSRTSAARKAAKAAGSTSAINYPFARGQPPPENVDASPPSADLA